MSRLILLFVAAVLGGQAFAEESYIEGQHFERISPAVKTAGGDKVEVVELFWYGLPALLRF